MTRHERVRCTTLARTLLDLAALVDRRRSLERAVERAEELRIFDLDALREQLRSNPRRRAGARSRRSSRSTVERITLADAPSHTIVSATGGWPSPASRRAATRRAS